MPTFTPTLSPTETHTPTPTATPTGTTTPLPAPPLAVPDSALVRPIGKDYPLPPDFAPSELRSLVSYPGIRVRPGREWLHGDPRALEALSRLFAAARQAGIITLMVDSAYRSWATQSTMWTNAGGWGQSRVAPPGTSEHQSGLAFDFAAYDNTYGFAATSASRWLRANAHRFGFVCTYPRAGIDAILAEPWHYRYVGVQTSSQLHALGYLDPGSAINPIEFYATVSEKSQR
jgi:D-alanyl-D-alanine carboxypeptidase